MPTWSILVPTLGERRALFERLMATLLPQTEKCGGRVQVRAWHNDGRPPLPEIRQKMVLATTTDYLCFVDDDDLVTGDYVDRIMMALADPGHPDYVGFQVQCYSDGVPTAVAYHSLEHSTWRNGNGQHFRDISHINPIKTSIARKVSFMRAGRRAEDRVWAEQLRRSGLLKSQVVVPHILYHYLYSTSSEPGQGSRWEKPNTIVAGARSAVSHPNFAWSN